MLPGSETAKGVSANVKQQTSKRGQRGHTQICACGYKEICAYLANSLVVVFQDNEAARSAYIQGTAATEAGRTLLKQFTPMEAAHNFFPWFGSNPADPPSRMSFSDAILKQGDESESASQHTWRKWDWPWVSWKALIQPFETITPKR